LVESGSSVTEGQVIATVETEKVMAELESPASGVISEILVSEGQTAAVGAVLARIQTSSD
jgi:pyruvate/2-oxoglutarate dehydrogenase complex dihydrolipoamide acyltransferase (E2) component